MIGLLVFELYKLEGIIPWDDDVDFVMMRDDYDKLLQFAKEGDPDLLPENYSFDIDDIAIIKLRRNDTTMIQPSYRLSKDNQGVWIDVFCLDVAPEDIKPVQGSRQLRVHDSRLRINGERYCGLEEFKKTLWVRLSN